MNFTETNKYRRLQCSECGIVYFFPEKWCATASRHGKSWKCPNGHGQYYRESSFDKLTRERDRLQQRLAEKDDSIQYEREERNRAQRQATAYKGHVTRIKNRIGKGVCPCCNRTFQNLARHMGSKHPDYSQAVEDAA